MHRLSFFLIVLSISLMAQVPHGDNFSLDCDICHTSETWKVDQSKITFDHSQTGFELLGQHQSVGCRSCHESLVFENVKTNCFECHTDVHETTLGKECKSCHGFNSWVVTNIKEIHDLGRFPLLGNHAMADCKDCHTSVSNLRFEPLGVTCYDCHNADYATTQNPNHAASGFSTDCEECHSLTDNQWSLAAFAHDFFPLTGGHQIGNCFECHDQNTFTGLSTDCYQCHKTDYESAQAIDHVAMGFDTDCSLCHTLNPGWSPAIFVNHNDIYPLLGAHAAIASDCNSCHSAGFANTPDQCYGCHESDYNSTTDPAHQSAGFSTDCEECHDQDAWTPATFDHDAQFFPIYSGEHNGEWDACSDCHTNSSNYAEFSCIDCHEHNRTDTDNEHGGINGYVYESNACLSCHPTGSGEGGFNHSTTNFPLTGSHVTVDCQECHVTGYQGTSTLCDDCHHDNYLSAPDHSALGYPLDCEQCHQTTAWEEATFDHNNTNFPLTGAHINQVCSDCHTSGFQGTSTLCDDCHHENYLSAEDHAALGYPTDCEQCHSTTSWEGSTFDHNNTNFPLTGAHVGQVCSDCHSSGFSNISTLCADCHTEDFNSTTNPNHQNLGLSNQCEDCHTTQPGWSPAQFPVHNDFFVLDGAHLSVPACADCHTDDYNNTPDQCFGCHETEYNSTTDPAHQSAGFSTDCETCHTSTAWEPATFDHDAQFFPIYSGEHNGEWNECSDCHSNQSNYADFTCIDCHEHNQADTDEEHRGVNGYVYASQECFACHPNGTGDGAFNHATSNFPLTGSHTSASCEDCHTSGYLGTSSLCYDCHNDVYNSSQNPSHQTLALSQDCEECHNTDAWNPSTFNHSTTGFELINGHQITDCSSCHTTDVSTTQNVCYDCHNDDYSTAPDHSSLGYPTDCEQCHATTNWQETSFNHNNTNFPLTGSHTNQNCNACHSEGFSGTSTECFDCHNDVYNSSQNPSHQTLALSHNCEGCHNTDAWKPSTFNHSTTGFELINGHQITDCSACHTTDVSTTQNVCYDCHSDDYSTAPDHSSLGYPTDCEQCHTTTNWQETSFNHNNTNFPLTGSHASQNCNACHSEGFSGTSTECFECHNDVYNSSQNPSHQTLALSHNCEECHNTDAWKPSTFNHSTTGFELINGHQITDCSACHTTDVSTTQNVCYDCHNDDYSTAPDHSSLGYPTNCEQCHVTTTWGETSFDHDNTNFPLTGAHIDQNCSECHSQGFTGTSTFCSDCHISDFNSTTNPDHQNLGLANQCDDCHTTNPGWSPAEFPVHDNFYQLLGAHASIQNNCSQCHNGDYNSTPNTCYGCHQSDYDGTSDPNHSAAQFPTDCEQCHSQNAWEPATFDHDGQYFPIYSGEHRNEWNACSDCHTNSSNYSVFSCIDCHEHNQSSMDSEHREVGGYVYSSTACYNCHPDGRGDDIIIPRTKNREF